MNKYLLAYGSAMSRIDDMKLFGGVSNGRTGREILESLYSLDPADRDENQVWFMTNPWIPMQQIQVTSSHKGRRDFRTWEGYRHHLYTTCEEWKPDIVICAVAVSNFTPAWIIEGRSDHSSLPPVQHLGAVEGKIDTRHTDRLVIEMVKTPNIINGVRERIGRDAVLVGFKLTSHGDIDRMVEHAQHVLTEARCDFVVANDLKLGLERKFFVTPTGMIEGTASDVVSIAKRILHCKQLGFYQTTTRVDVEPFRERIRVALSLLSSAQETWPQAKALWEQLKPFMPKHGCFALRLFGKGFYTTTRGKKTVAPTEKYPSTEALPLTVVWEVDHDQRTLITGRGRHSEEKATLNAPLLSRLFNLHPKVSVIVHLHRIAKSAYRLADYTPSGTLVEAELAAKSKGVSKMVAVVLNIEGHGAVIGFRTTDIAEIVAWLKDEENWA